MFQLAPPFIANPQVPVASAHLPTLGAKVPRGVPGAVELRWIGMGAALARHSVDSSLVPKWRPSYGTSARARSWFGEAEIYAAPNAAFKLYDGFDTIACACVAKLTQLGTSGIISYCSARAVSCRVRNIQWAGTLH